MARQSKASTTASDVLRARVLVAGQFGQPDDLVELPAAQIEAGVASGELDAHRDAVAYALTLRSSAAPE